MTDDPSFEPGATATLRAVSTAGDALQRALRAVDAR
jgi:hypothetical protein